ncbi:uncharacterized protein [Rutidosis leptorrhynchoides]|uniref:uncharacterized protein n=1 Tax=Rutidosis leptorrhynchoides TaxID=125765 RepID=UPI003A99F3AE
MTSYSICVNGDLHGFFKGKRGLHQGDPMSPYLFTLVMEVLTLMLERNASRSDSFRYHPKCDKLKIINLCFADVLFLFAHGSIGSVRVIQKSLDEFKRCSGLNPSLLKNTAFFANVKPSIKNQILAILPFDEGSLPVRYLGLPLFSSRLMYRDCIILVDRVRKRINDWKNKFLSFAEIEKLLCGFLWCQRDLKRGKAKQSLWVKWVHEYKLASHHFWTIPIVAGSPWSWREIFQVRAEVRPYFIFQIGNGMRASAMFEAWISLGPIASHVNMNDIILAKLERASVRELVHRGGVSNEWIQKYHVLNSVTLPMLWNVEDTLCWKVNDDTVGRFSGAHVWETIRPHAGKFNWYHVVWFSHCIPKHAFVMWLLMGERLKTQDRLKPWELRANPILKCSLCNDCMDSHAHLFFQCSFSMHVWERVTKMLRINVGCNDWKGFVQFKLAASVLG